MKKLLLAGIAAALVFGCKKTQEPNKPPFSLEEVRTLICGSYQGRYAEGTEYFEIKTNNTFSQRFVRSGAIVYESGGDWILKKLEDRYQVSFEPFMDLEDAILQKKAPRKLDGRGATFFEEEPVIYFFGDIDYFITKQKAEESNK